MVRIKDAMERGRQATRRINSAVQDRVAGMRYRVVSNPDPEEQEPRPVNAKPIISINGQDVETPPKREYPAA